VPGTIATRTGLCICSLDDYRASLSHPRPQWSDASRRFLWGVGGTIINVISPTRAVSSLRAMSSGMRLTVCYRLCLSHVALSQPLPHPNEIDGVRNTLSRNDEEEPPTWKVGYTRAHANPDHLPRKAYESQQPKPCHHLAFELMKRTQ